MMRIFSGPMWRYEPVMQAQQDQPISVNPMNPQQVATVCKSERVCYC